ncbi:MAG TPA: DUF1501 domain-containing protein [Pirellulales bacterium]|jgi:hypothetical protein|nr:DUF1501 domain-containing protein [Pirellulales bacterium]
MLRLNFGRTARYCDGFSRRNFLQIGMAGMGSLGLPQLLRARAESVKAGAAPKETSVILIWLDGGPSHMDLYDMKPDAPPESRGIWSPIKTNVPGMEISELLPHQAKVADKFAILRSLHHDNGDHFTAAHYMLTSRGGASGGDTTAKFPGIGAIAAKAAGARKPSMPPYVSVPYASSVGLRPGYFGATFLGANYNPFETDGDPNSPNFKVHNLDPIGGMSIARLNERHAMLRQFDHLRRAADESNVAQALDQYEQRAFDLVTGSAAQKAFDIDSEDKKTRDLYGRTGIGQSCLLARRLTEAGCTFVTCHSGGWDHHWDLEKGMNNLMPQVDQAFAGLLTDLANRGTLGKTLVLLCGEFSRTPKMNNGSGKGTPGRDHWGNSMFCLLAGGGVQGGRIVGATNPLGEYPTERPCTPGDLHATVYHVLGIDPQTTYYDRLNRPFTAVSQGDVIQELL